MGFFAWLGLAIFDQYRGGFFSLPDIPDGAYPLSFKNGLRAIVLDADVSDHSYDQNWKYFRHLSLADPDRRYLGFPYDVPAWFEDTWSFCKKPTTEEANWIQNQMPKSMRDQVATARFDAVCIIEADGKKILRGLIYSVPDL